MGNDRPIIRAGDIIEFTHRDLRQTAEVMLVTDEGLALLDLFDGDRPVYAYLDRLDNVAVFDPAA